MLSINTIDDDLEWPWGPFERIYYKIIAYRTVIRPFIKIQIEFCDLEYLLNIKAKIGSKNIV